MTTEQRATTIAEDKRDQIRADVDAKGQDKVAADLGCSRGTLARLMAGLPCQPATVEVALARLKARRR